MAKEESLKMEETKKEPELQQDFTQDFPKNFFLFSVTLIVNNARKFADIPVMSHRLIFPNRQVIYGFACDHFGIPHDNIMAMESFAVVGIYKFENEEDYVSYTQTVNNGIEVSEIADE